MDNKKDYIWGFLLQIISTGLLFGLHILSARVLSVESYGIFNYALTLASTLSIVTCLGFQNSIIRFVSEYNIKSQFSLLHGFLFFSACLVLLASLGGSLVLLLASNFTSDESMYQSLRYAVLLLPIISVGIWRARMARGFNSLKAAIIPEEIVRTTLIITFLLLWILLSDSVLMHQLLVSVYVSSSVVAFVVGIVYLAKIIPPGLFSSKRVRKTRVWIKSSLSMMSGGISQEVINRSDVLLIGYFLGVTHAGIYGAALKLSLLNVFVLKVVDVVVAPKIATSFFSGNKKELKNVIVHGVTISALGAAPSCIFMIFFPELLLGLFGPDYTQASTVLVILVVGQFVNAVTGPVGHSLLMTGEENFYAKIIFPIMIINLSLQLLVIPLYGVFGAAIVTTTTVIVFNCSLLFATYKKYLVN